MSSRMCRGNKISLTFFGASSPDYHPCNRICVKGILMQTELTRKTSKAIVRQVRSVCLHHTSGNSGLYDGTVFD